MTKVAACQLIDAADSTMAMIDKAVCMARDRSRPVPAELAPYLRPDGSAVVPAEIAADLMRIVVLGLSARVKADGGHVSPQARTILFALHQAAQRHEEAVTAPPAGPQPAGSLSVAEAAEVMGCSTRWVRQLLKLGRLPGRRSGGVWLVDSPLPISEANSRAG